nr:hypothetical protein [Tanacetum cinerariifolium]
VAQNPRVQNDGNQNQIGNSNLVAVHAEGNAVGHNRNQIRCYNCKGVGNFARDCTIGNGNLVAVRAEGNAAGNNGNQIRSYNCRGEEAGIQLQGEEYDLMAVAADLDEIEEVNANCILMANLQQASSSAERIAKIQDPFALMANSNNPYASPAPHQDLSPFNQNYMQQPMPNPKDISNPTTAMNMALALMAKAFKLNYSTPTNNNQRISSNPRNRQIAQPGMNMGQDRQMQMIGGNGGNQFRQYAGNLNGYNAVQNVGNQVSQNDVQNPRV